LVINKLIGFYEAFWIEIPSFPSAKIAQFDSGASVRGASGKFNLWIFEVMNPDSPILLCPSYYTENVTFVASTLLSMNIEDLRIYCLAKPGATEDFPFDEETLVIRVMQKIFAILPLERGACINLKCDPDLVISLREHYRAVEPAYHMNKKHWNTVYADRDAGTAEICQWIDHSYELIVNALPKKVKAELELLSGKHV
jgi:predicted DNA-binding protein (MmcQ/YjbR family)